MNITLEKIWQAQSFDGDIAIRLDWSNDRHHQVIIRHNRNVECVADALIQLARLIRGDIHLKQG